MGYANGGIAEIKSSIIEDDFEFSHDISSEKDSSGSPIIH